MGRIGEGGTFFDELPHPGEEGGVREIDIAGFYLGATAFTRACLPPSGLTGIMPQISRRRLAMTAAPLALSSISMVLAAG